jgi:hypothetical protein
MRRTPSMPVPTGLSRFLTLSRTRAIGNAELASHRRTESGEPVPKNAQENVAISSSERRSSRYRLASGWIKIDNRRYWRRDSEIKAMQRSRERLKFP